MESAQSRTTRSMLKKEFLEDPAKKRPLLKPGKKTAPKWKMKKNPSAARK